MKQIKLTYGGESDETEVATIQKGPAFLPKHKHDGPAQDVADHDQQRHPHRHAHLND
jgi:hypothetical protein